MSTNAKLSNNFYLSEFLVSRTATRLNIPMYPPLPVRFSLRRLCTDVLQPIRDCVGPMVITSGYRPKKLNDAVGGATNSAHLTGSAADFIVPGVDTDEVFELIMGLTAIHPEVDVCINEYSSWIHIQRTDGVARREFLLAVKDSTVGSGVRYKYPWI